MLSTESPLKEYWHSYSKDLSRILTGRFAGASELSNLEQLRLKVSGVLQDIKNERPELNGLEDALHSLETLGNLIRNAMSENSAEQIHQLSTQMSEDIENLIECVNRHENYSEHILSKRRKVWIQKLFFIPSLVILLIAGLTYIGIRLYLAR